MLEDVFWCQVVDGVNLEHKPLLSSPHTIDEEDKQKWDYCTPATVADISKEDNEDNNHPASNTNGQGGNIQRR